MLRGKQVLGGEREWLEKISGENSIIETASFVVS